MTKRHVALLFGGRSVEHAVSITSARCILDALDPTRDRISLLAVDPAGRWRIGEVARGPEEAFSGHEVVLPAMPASGLLVTDASSGKISQLEIDVVFPIIHGQGGEDGSLQGLLELANLPYVGSGILSSAIQMDKEVTKRLLEAAGLPVVPYCVLMPGRLSPRDREAAVAKALAEIGLPAFVKPSNSGSSVGATLVEEASHLAAAVDHAARYGEKVLVEKAIHAREIEVAVLDGDEPIASPPGEIRCDQSFYNYEAKYAKDETELIIPAELAAPFVEQLQRFATTAFRVVGAEGMARVDFLVDRKSGQAYISELNSLPGFTEGSMFPKLFEAAGIRYAELLDRLIELALGRHARRQRFETHYTQTDPEGADR